MSEERTEIQGVPAILAYDDYVPVHDPGRRWLLVGYWAGLMGTYFLWGVIGFGVEFYIDQGSLLVRAIDGFAPPLGVSLLALFPATISLGLSVWVRTRLIRQVRYARFRTAFWTGMAGGAFPPMNFRFLGLSETTMLWVLLGLIVWHFIFPAVASVWLCYRSNVRD